jgi:hypothetical protein
MVKIKTIIAYLIALILFIPYTILTYLVIRDKRNKTSWDKRYKG